MLVNAFACTCRNLRTWTRDWQNIAGFSRTMGQQWQSCTCRLEVLATGNRHRLGKPWHDIRVMAGGVTASARLLWPPVPGVRGAPLCGSVVWWDGSCIQWERGRCPPSGRRPGQPKELLCLNSQDSFVRASANHQSQYTWLQRYVGTASVLATPFVFPLTSCYGTLVGGGWVPPGATRPRPQTPSTVIRSSRV